MADLPVVKTNWLVSPDSEQERKWMQKEIQQKRNALFQTKSEISKNLQMIEDIKNGIILGLEANAEMYQKEIKFLEEKLKIKSAN